MDAGVDRVMVFSAFRRLPARWQEVLWYTEIEQLKPAQVGPRLGMKPAAAAQLALAQKSRSPSPSSAWSLPAGSSRI